MHYYKKNLGDYAKKAGRLSILQHGVYNLLLDACYDRESFPTREEAIDWVWASTSEEIEAVEFVLRRFFELQEDGKYVQNRIKEELNEYLKFCAEQSEKAKKGGRPRKASGKDKKPGGFTNEPDGNPAASQRGQNKTLTTNHKPLTTNQFKKNYKKIELDLPDSLLPAAQEFIDHRANLKKPLTQNAFDRFMATVFVCSEELGLTPDKIVAEVIDAGWQSVKPDWLINRLGLQGERADSRRPKETPADRMRRELEESQRIIQ